MSSLLPAHAIACVSSFQGVTLHQRLSAQVVLGGGGVCGGGVVRQGAAAAGPRPAVQQVLELSGHAAGERRVDPRVGARVQIG